MLDTSITCVLSLFKNVVIKIKIDYAFYKLMNNLEPFQKKGFVNEGLCAVSDDGDLNIYL